MLKKSSWFRKHVELKKVPMKIPSDFEIAKTASNWLSMSQDYYVATQVLHETLMQANKAFHSVKVFDEEGLNVLGKTGILNPLLLLMGHCIELRVKGICIQTKGEELITLHKNKLTTHDTNKLCQLGDIEVNESEQYLLLLLSDCVIFGKYPTDKVEVKKQQTSATPDKKHSLHPQTFCHIDELYPAFDSFYQKLGALIN